MDVRTFEGFLLTRKHFETFKYEVLRSMY